MALPATDDFTGTNGAQVSARTGWAANVHDCDIQSNAANADAAGNTEVLIRWSGDTFDNDQYAEGTLAAAAANNYIGPAVRVSTSGAHTCYEYATNNGTIYFGKFVAGSYTEFGNASAPSTSTVLRIEAEGTTIRVYQDAGLEDSQTDSGIASGAAGISGYDGNNVTSIDNWEGGNLSTGGTEYNQSAAGTLTSAGAIVKDTATDRAGALTSAGALLKETQPAALTGALTSAGALVGQGQKALSGVLSGAGALVKEAGKPIAGALTSAGELARQTAKPLAGTLTSAGAVSAVKTALLSLAGTLTSAGAVVKETSLNYAGTLTSAGAILKQTALSHAGTLTSGGVLGTVKTVLLSLGGALTTAGTVAGQGHKALAGTLTTAGTVVKQTAVSYAGALTTAGALVKQAVKSFAGALSSAGALVTEYTASEIITALVSLTAQARGFSLTARDRVFDLAAQARDFTLTVKDRDN